MWIARSAARLGATVLYALTLVACSGRGPVSLTPQLSSSGNPKSVANVSFLIKIPAPPGLHPAYVSPATQSAVVGVTGSITVPPTTIACSIGSCSGQVQAPIGNDTFSVTLYDLSNGAGAILAKGSVAQTITANQTNTVKVAFGGVIASIHITLAPNGVTIGTAATITVNAQGRDADGYAIIGGNPYTVPITLADSDTSGATVLSTTNVLSPQTSVTVAYNGSNAFQSATISGSAPGVPSGEVTPDTLTTKAAALSGPSVAPNSAWGPPAVASALSFPVQNGYNGAGQTVAIVMDAFPSASDLNAFLSYFQIPATSRTITDVPIDGGPNGSDPNGPGEVTLDTETVAALAPGANIIVYGIPSLNAPYINDAFNQAISDGAAKVVSFSAGGCETASMVSAGTPIFQTAANDGVAFVASSGDQGNECFTGGAPQYQVGVSYPASDASVIGVGGTETTPPNQLTSTTAWNDYSCSSGQCATGGGVSQFVPIPSFQQSIAGEASAQYRNIPDVAMPAEDVAVYVNGAWSAMNGTSWSAPEFAALQAEVDQYCNLSYSDPATVPYYVFQYAQNSFIGVVNGNNQFAGTAPYYSAGPGFDNVSGLGVPNGVAYANAICPNRVPTAAARRIQALGARAAMTAGPRVLDVRTAARGLADLGVRASSAPTTIQLVLQPTVDLVSNEQSVVRALESHGFQIVKTFTNNLVVDAQAPSSTVSAFFQTELHNVEQARYGRRYAPVTNAVLPASIAPYVSGVILDNVVTTAVP